MPCIEHTQYNMHYAHACTDAHTHRHTHAHICAYSQVHTSLYNYSLSANWMIKYVRNGRHCFITNLVLVRHFLNLIIYWMPPKCQWYIHYYCTILCMLHMQCYHSVISLVRHYTYHKFHIVTARVYIIYS